MEVPIERMTDITDRDPGLELDFDVTVIQWKDSETLQWGTAGPGRDTNVRIEYLATPLQMVEEGDEPDLIPYRFRWLLVWRAAVIALTVADQAVPPIWSVHIRALQSQFHSSLSKGHPMVNDPPVISSDPYDYDVWY